jgi:transcriptional regulator with XRE-family HTH domain
MKVAKVLAAARRAKKLSQADLATKLGVSPGTVAGWESGTHGIRMGRLPAIAKALGVEVSELVA